MGRADGILTHGESMCLDRSWNAEMDHIATQMPKEMQMTDKPEQGRHVVTIFNGARYAHRQTLGL